MTQELFFTREQIKDIRNFLDSIPYRAVFTQSGYDIEPILVTEKIGKYEIWLSDNLIDFIKTFDHDCKSGNDDGCNFCQHLIDLNIIPDVDGFDWLRLEQENNI